MAASGYFEGLSLTESSTADESNTDYSDYESFKKRVFKKKKPHKPTLKRSKRQGMCLLSNDERFYRRCHGFKE